jgi:methionine sulfoxide reductase heme-binding subunit
MVALRWRKHEFTWLQVLTHLGALAPFVYLLWDYFNDNLSVNPIQDITFRTGKPALVLLVLSLACTPLNSLFGFRAALKLRRPLGVYAFLYVCLHLLTFVGLDYGFDTGLIYEAIFEKRYALVGFAAFLLLLPLFFTSTKGWQRRLGKRWKTLHQLVYVVAPLAVFHYLWLVKSDIRQPLFFGALVALLLILRVPVVKQRARAGWNALVARLRPAPVARRAPAPFRPPRAEVKQPAEPSKTP